MATFTINQARHLFVANAVSSSKFDAEGVLGTIYPRADKAKETLYFQQNGAGGPVSSDKITIKNIKYAKATSSDALAKKLNRLEIKLDKNVNGGLPIPNQDYVLRLTFTQYIGMGDEDVYFKHALVHGVKNMTASDFYGTLALSLQRAVSRDLNKLVKIFMVTKTSEDEGDETAEEKEVKKGFTFGESDKFTSIILEEVPQDWRLGIISESAIPFTANTLEVTEDGTEVLWGTVTKVAPKNVLPNGKTIADLEHFFMGARGDIYRGMGYPNNIQTTYLVDPSKVYDTLDIHFYFEGSNEGPQKSEKTLTIVAPNTGSHTAMNALITEVVKVSGLKIETLK